MDPNLTGVPETMLWTLHNRASEARRPDGVIDDPDCLRIHDAIDYDYEANFGSPNPSHGIRSAVFDGEVRRFAAARPRATIVNLGEGLETQRYRVSELDARWVSVDLADAIAVRERFIPPDDEHLHIASSALDPAWMEAVPDGPVHITAQGLLMYFEESEVDELIRSIAVRFPGAWLSFDTIPGWLSQRTLRGMQLTPTYTAPPMPFGTSRRDLPPKIAGLVPGAAVREIPYRFPRGPGRWLFPVFCAVPLVGPHTPSMWTVEFPSRPA